MLPTPAEKLQNFFGVFLQFHIGVDIPQTIKASKAGGSSGSSGGSKSSGSSASSGSSSASSGLSESYTSYLSEDRGKSPVARDMISGVAAGAVSMIAKVLPNQ